jgi:integrase
VLKGRGVVLRYANGNSAGKYFYRELIQGTKKYRYICIEDATSLEEAIEMASDAAIELREGTPQANQPIEKIDPLNLIAREEKLQRDRERLLKAERRGETKSVSIESAIDAFLHRQYKRVLAGTFAKASYSHKYHCLLKVKAYLASKGLVRTSQINTTTFDDYLEFRGDTTRILQARELAVLGEWIKSYLVRNNYINSNLWLSGTFLPKVEVRMVDRMANPAINPDDWRTIVNHIRDTWRKEAFENEPYYMKGELKGVRGPHKRSMWYRTMFWHYILFAKNTGMSPEEILKLKWKNVEIRDVGRLSKSKFREEVEELEAEGIDVIVDGFDEEGIDENAWAPGESHIGREERLIAYITTIRSKTKQAREIPCNQGRELKRLVSYQKKYMSEWGIDYKITNESYVFFNPWNDFGPLSQQRAGRTWRVEVDKLQKAGKLKGHKFSDHKYTMYSMRSTFIEDHLLKGTDIFLVARIAGHDVKTLMQTYERLDIKNRAEEITAIQYGKKKRTIPSVDVLAD